MKAMSCVRRNGTGHRNMVKEAVDRETLFDKRYVIALPAH